jgi:hypothetical protein
MSNTTNMRRMRSNRQVASFTVVPEPDYDPMTMDPDELRNRLRDSLLTRPFDERSVATNRIATGLKNAGLNVGATAVLLGIPGETVSDLTPSDIAHLVRYVRINRPEILKAVTQPLIEVLTRTSEPVRRVHQPRKAA